MYAAIHRIAGMTSSSTLDAAAKDNLADVLTSTAAFLGILGAHFIHPLADAIGGILVAAWIFKSAWEVWQENLSYLSGGGAPAELRAAIVEAAQGVDGVALVHQVITEHVGPDLVADLHVNVDGNMTVFEAHRSRTRCGHGLSSCRASTAPTCTSNRVKLVPRRE